MSNLKEGDMAWVIQTPQCHTEMMGKLVTVNGIFKTALLFCPKGFLGCPIHSGTCASAGGMNHPIHWLKKHNPDGVNKYEVDKLYQPITHPEEAEALIRKTIKVNREKAKT